MNNAIKPNIQDHNWFYYHIPYCIRLISYLLITFAVYCLIQRNMQVTIFSAFLAFIGYFTSRELSLRLAPRDKEEIFKDWFDDQCAYVTKDGYWSLDKLSKIMSRQIYAPYKTKNGMLINVRLLIKGGNLYQPVYTFKELAQMYKPEIFRVSTFTVVDDATGHEYFWNKGNLIAKLNDIGKPAINAKWLQKNK